MGRRIVEVFQTHTLLKRDGSMVCRSISTHRLKKLEIGMMFFEIVHCVPLYSLLILVVEREI